MSELRRIIKDSEITKEDDQKPEPDRAGRQELEIVIGDEHISFTETERLIAEPAPGIEAHPHEDNLHFDVVIAGPSQSPFEGGSFKLELFLPDDYPMAPKVRFLTKIYHPNIDKLDDPLANDVAHHWKENEMAAIQTGI
ncbi:hypothetical protein BSLG_005729 [Batrachochytrium salamandrivorans]|nr:hypothetical protein BSLG_005729 [Batrachochytrium salamandrivorans]